MALPALIFLYYSIPFPLLLLFCSCPKLQLRS